MSEKFEQKKQEALRFFGERFATMDKARNPFYLRMEEDEKLYRSHLEYSQKADWQSKLFIPRTYGLVMASLSEFAINKPDISVEPDTRIDAMRAPYLKASMYANWRKNKGNAELLFGILDALKLGIGVIEVGYRKDLRKIKDIIKYEPETETMEWKEKEIIDFDDVYFECVNPRHIWVDEAANSFSNAIDCVRKYSYGKQAFHYIWDSKFSGAVDVKSRGELLEDPFFKPYIGIEPEEEIVVYKYINKAKDVQWWIANGTLLNNPDDPIPFHHKQLPYADIKLAPYDKYTFYGMSLPHLIKDLQYELNTHRNMMVDQTHLNIFSPFFYSAEEELDESIFTIEPGVGIPVTDPSSFQFFKQGQVGSDAYRSIEMLDDDTRQATGFDLRLQGLTGGGTATETSILKETALKRINLYLRFLEELSMPDFAELWKDTLQQFYFMSSDVKSRKVKNKKDGSEKDEIFRSIKIPKADISSFRTVDTVGEFNFLNVTPTDIRGKFDVNVRIGSTIAVSKELNKQVKLQLYSIMSADELVKREKLVADVLKSHDLDPEEYMTISQQVDVEKSIALAEEHNKELLAGRTPQIIPELTTPEHIQVHDAFVRGSGLAKGVKQKVQQHVLQEMNASKMGIMPMGGSGQTESPAVEKNPQLTQKLSSAGGMPLSTVIPETPAETGTQIGRPVVKP